MIKFVLCRPLGGLNDILCQIEKCCRYADRFGRTVLLDTNYKHSGHFKDKFSNYFESLWEGLVIVDTLNDEFFQSLTVYPRELHGRCNSYEYYYNRESKLSHDRASKVPITFDLAADYEESLLIHTQAGGGDLSLLGIQRFRLHEALASEFVWRLRQIGEPYSAVHVRNTDIKTDYSDALDELAANEVSPLFIATDNKEVLEHFRSTLSSSRIFSFSDLGQEAGRALHLNIKSVEEAYTRNKDAILDLLTLARADRLLICKADMNGVPKSGYSGYSRLARNLNKNQNLLKSLVNRDELDHLW